MKRILSLLTLMLSGLILNSLWVSKNDEWKIYLPLDLITISLYLIIQTQSNKES